MGIGHLVSVRSQSSGGATISYVVSEPDVNQAVEIIKNEIAALADEVVEVCRVSEQLLDALGVPPGGFRRADGHQLKAKNSTGGCQLT
jgi:hypothetical protein